MKRLFKPGDKVKFVGTSELSQQVRPGDIGFVRGVDYNTLYPIAVDFKKHLMVLNENEIVLIGGK